jgi:hypothetical protein
MIFLRFRHFLILNLIRNPFKSEGCHVVLSYSPIPVWPDLRFGPLDLKKIEWLRYDGTVSLSDLIWPIGSRSNGVGVDREKLTGEGCRRRGRWLWGSTPRWFWRFPRLVDVTTVFRRRWRRRWCAGLGSLLPVTEERGSWSVVVSSTDLP